MAWPNDKRTPGSPLGFSTEVARVGIGILGGEWLLELYGWLQRWDQRRVRVVVRQGDLFLRHSSRRVNQNTDKPLMDRGKSAVFIPLGVD